MVRCRAESYRTMADEMRELVQTFATMMMRVIKQRSFIALSPYGSKNIFVGLKPRIHVLYSCSYFDHY